MYWWRDTASATVALQEMIATPAAKLLYDHTLLSGSKFTTTGIPGELHLPGYSFCGPGTNLNKRLDEAANPKPWSKPKNTVDEVCMRHDIDYENSTTLEEKHEADREMLYYFSLIRNPTFREKNDRFIMKKMISAKLRPGLGK